MGGGGMSLYHYTCVDHGRAGIGDEGLIVPAAHLTDRDLPWMSHLVWLTDLPVPQREALGLTSRFARCDRTAHRYRVTGGDVVAWWRFARAIPREVREQLEGAEGARPVHWFVSAEPVPAVYDPNHD